MCILYPERGEKSIKVFTLDDKKMSVLDTAKARFSVRAYTEQTVEEEKLQKILEIAHVAPTATNRQPVRVLVVRSREGRRQFPLFGFL